VRLKADLRLLLLSHLTFGNVLLGFDKSKSLKALLQSHLASARFF
jgi:hypothetical protein